MKSPMNEFLRRYQPDQVLRFRVSYGLSLNQGVTWFPCSHFGLFEIQTYTPPAPMSRAKRPYEALNRTGEGFWL